MQIIEIDVIVFGYGRITQQLIKKLQQSNISVICVTNNEHSQREINFSEDIQFYSRGQVVNTKLNSKTAIFSWRNADPLLNNAQRIQNWLSSNQFSADRSFLLSSGAVYQDCLSAQGEADTNLEKTFDRGKKLFLEESLLTIFQQKKIKHMNLRISNTYGAGLDYGFIGSAVNSILSGSPIKIFEKRNVIRDYVSVNDVIYAINELIKLDSSERAVNLSTGIGTSVSQVLEIFKSCGYFLENRIFEIAPSDLKHSSILSPQLLSSMIDWQPSNLPNGIAELMSDKFI